MIKLVAELSAGGINTYFVPQDLSGPGQWIDYDELDGMLLAHVAKERPRWSMSSLSACWISCWRHSC